MRFSLPSRIAKITQKYKMVKDEIGMSPTEVYKYTDERQVFYLKVSGKQFKGTTYDVEREKNVLLWLENKIHVPKVVEFESDDEYVYLLMSEVDGECLVHKKGISPRRIVEIYAESIRKIQSIDISSCIFSSHIDFRLSELDYLFNNKLTAEDDFWEANTNFESPQHLIYYLKTHKPNEELTFSHGDLCNGNIIVNNNSISGYVDWARGGKADKWYDIAFCIRSIRHELQNEQYVDLFFNILELDPNWNKIQYFIMLDELF